MTSFYDPKAGWSLWRWPFFEDSHYELADSVLAWLKDAQALAEEPDLAKKGRAIVQSLGEAGLLHYLVPDSLDAFDVRSLCVIREALTYNDALFDAMFTMQGIGTLAIQEHGTPGQKEKYLDPCRDGSGSRGGRCRRIGTRERVRCGGNGHHGYPGWRRLRS